MALRQQVLDINGTVIEYGYDPTERLEPDDLFCPGGCYVFRVQEDRFGTFITRARFTTARQLREYVDEVKRHAAKNGGKFVNVRLKQMIGTQTVGVMPE